MATYMTLLAMKFYIGDIVNTYTLSTVVFAAIGGIILGLFISKLFGQKQKQNKILNEQLDETKKQLREYQNDVADHFNETSQLIKQMAENHKKISQHLITGASTLAHIDITTQLGMSQVPGALTDNLEPPKDWAPQAGALREDYGLSPNDVDLAASTAPGNTAKRNDNDPVIDVTPES